MNLPFKSDIAIKVLFTFVVIMSLVCLGQAVLIVILRHKQLVAEATPPSYGLTKEEFVDWRKPFEFGIVEFRGEKYKVAFSKSGRIFASGPSLYLFDDNGIFDWTPDVNDSESRKFGYDLEDLSISKISKKDFLQDGRID